MIDSVSIFCDSILCGHMYLHQSGNEYRLSQNPNSLLCS